MSTPKKKKLDTLSIQKMDNGYVVYATFIGGGSETRKVYTDKEEMVNDILSQLDSSK